MGTILVWATAWAFVAVIARMVAQPNRRAAGGGKRLRAELDAIYGGEHEYARVTPAAFPDADLAYYDRAGAELEAMGFRRIADVEDLTLSRVYPERRTFLRVFVDEGGAIRAAIYHLRIRSGGMALLSAVGMAPRDLHVVDLVSEVPRGQFIATSNTRGLDKLTAPKEVDIERLEVGASTAQVVSRHRARLTEHARRRGADAPVPLWTWEDVLASIQRGHVVATKHRQSVGGLSREEVERFTGRPLTSAEEVFLHEVRGDKPAVNDAATSARETNDTRGTSDTRTADTAGIPARDDATSTRDDATSSRDDATSPRDDATTTPQPGATDTTTPKPAPILTRAVDPKPRGG
jgi:hypothetical protein